MKKIINIRNSIIIILCVTIIIMTIGFIILSVKLQNKNSEVNKFNVVFSSVKKDSSTKGGDIEPQGMVDVKANGKELDMNFTLNYFHDEISYIVKVKNEGTVSAIIVDLLESPNYKDVKFNSLIDPVTISYNDIVGRELKPQEELELKITIYYNPSTISGSRNFNYKLGLITESV